MIEWFWRRVAALLTRPTVLSWLFDRSLDHPHEPLRQSRDREIIAARYWVFNGGTNQRRRTWLPAVRLHWHLTTSDEVFDSPWGVRSIVLVGRIAQWSNGRLEHRIPGDTWRTAAGIGAQTVAVSDDGCWVLHIMGRRVSPWPVVA